MCRDVGNKERNTAASQFVRIKPTKNLTDLDPAQIWTAVLDYEHTHNHNSRIEI